MRTTIITLAALVASASAVAVPLANVNNFTDGTTFNAAALTGFSTTGADMDGSLVFIVTGAGGTSPSVAWTDIDADSGEAANAFWSLRLDGDSFGGVWTFTNLGVASGITSVTFNGVPGNTVFDVIPVTFNSPGSAQGTPLSNVDGPAALGTVTGDYTNRLRIGGVFYDDLYTQLTVSFDGLLRTGESVTWVADTDNADPDRGGIVTPTPASLAVLGLGLAFLGMRRRG